MVVDAGMHMVAFSNCAGAAVLSSAARLCCLQEAFVIVFVNIGAGLSLSAFCTWDDLAVAFPVHVSAFVHEL